MRKYFYFAMVAICTITMIGCTNSKKTNNSDGSNADTTQVADMHNAENSLDYFGIYTGTIPAADCPGIEVTLVFNKNKTYTQKYVYIDRKGADFDETGTFSIDGNLLETISENGEKSYYKVQEGRVMMLDKDKQPITGELADMFILKQEKVF